MLIDRLQSLIAVLITLIGVLLANSASEPLLPTDFSNETHRQSNNKSLNKNYQDCDGADKQRFYEVSCKPGVEGKPCLFMERKLHGHSTCVQRYSYSYAIVREENARHHHGVGGGQYNNNGGKQTFQSLFPNDNNVWKLDYIKVRSGCACMVQTPKKKQQKQRRKNGGSGGGGGGAGGSSGGGKSRSQHGGDGDDATAPSSTVCSASPIQ
ncbi:hypothetical protein QTP88_003952 [Uroleucon formosanum]